MTSCVILQPSYVPWLGTFQLMAEADVYVHYDDVNFDAGGWRNRNLLKGPNGLFWITIPVSLPKGRRGTMIKDARINEESWVGSHLRSVGRAYSKAPHIDWVQGWLTPALQRQVGSLCDVTVPMLELCADKMGLSTRFLRSSELGVLPRERNLRLIEICRQVGANLYLSGPSARSYLDLDLFSRHDIEVQFVVYRDFVYPQLHGEFMANVSVLDAFAMLGPDASRLL